ncbi:hypothetical protein LguiA_026240 [Lonicera macranthoides]
MAPLGSDIDEVVVIECSFIGIRPVFMPNTMTDEPRTSDMFLSFLTQALGSSTAVDISVRNERILNILSATNIADMNPETTATAHLQISKGTSQWRSQEFEAGDALPHHPPQLTASHRKNCQGKVDEDGTPAIFQALTRVECGEARKLTNRRRNLIENQNTLNHI